VIFVEKNAVMGGEIRKLSGFSEFGIVHAPLGDAVAF